MKYKPKPVQQLKNWHDSKVRSGKSNFKDFKQFQNWYSLQPKACHYCGLKEEDSYEIVMNSILKSKRFPQTGIIGQGKNRGVWLEIDRYDPCLPYSEENCVLCCYFCNNDKSDIFTGIEYKAFFQNRLAYLMNLTQRNASGPNIITTPGDITF